MIHINLLPKPKEEKSIRQIGDAISGLRKLIQWRSDNIIKLQDEVISAMRSLLQLYGIMRAD